MFRFSITFQKTLLYTKCIQRRIFFYRITDIEPNISIKVFVENFTMDYWRIGNITLCHDMPPHFFYLLNIMDPKYSKHRDAFSINVFEFNGRGAMRNLQYCLLFVKVCVNKRSSDKY